MSEQRGGVPGDLLRKVLERILSRRVLDDVLVPTLADLQHEDDLVRTAPAWRRAFVLTRGYAGIWTALALSLASCPARSLRRDWLEEDAPGPSLLRALAPRAGILGLALTVLMGAQWALGAQAARLRLAGGSAALMLALLPSNVTLAIPVAFLLGLLLALNRLSATSAALPGTRGLGPALALSITSGLLTLGLYGWITPQANQMYREQMMARWIADNEPSAADGRPIQLFKGSRELTIGELQTHIREARREGKRTVELDVEWHKKWAIPAACLAFGPLGIGLHGLWRRPRPAMNLALAAATTFLLYVALRTGEEAALRGELRPLPAIWAGDAVLALVTFCLIARLPRTREGAIPA
jgi:lipopolysaccharide export LptBFGC system permease protein LptF